MNHASLAKPVKVSARDFESMLSLVTTLHSLQQSPTYLHLLQDKLPDTVLFQPASDSILMGYDFHLGPDGPQLIEINNNAGGLFTGTSWLTQPDIPELYGSIEQRLVEMFPESWRNIAIMDEQVEEQYMYHEMLAFSKLLKRHGRRVIVLSPEDLSPDQDGVLQAGGMKIDAIYNRHTDFYLQSKDMAHICSAYVAGKVHLTPNPHSYGLLGDKRRMVDWWHEGLLESVNISEAALKLIREIVPEIHLLSEMDRDLVWKDRKKWVFKPVARHGGKGVLLGKNMSRKRYHAMEPDQTVMQRYVQPSEVLREGEKFKLDLRLYTHADHLVAIGGRVYQGLLTNFRTPGSGFVPVEIFP
ncbi:MAG: hypothetical protein ACE5DY_07585 [Mariprofundaceae bacterium]